MSRPADPRHAHTETNTKYKAAPQTQQLAVRRAVYNCHCTIHTTNMEKCGQIVGASSNSGADAPKWHSTMLLPIAHNPDFDNP